MWQLYEIGALGVPVPRHKGKARRYFYTRRDGKQNQPVLYVRDGIDGADRALVDVNALAADGTRSLDWWVPSEDGARLAYGVSANGSEESVLRVRDVASGRDLPDEIPRTRACSLAWLPDGKGFYYTRYPAPGTVPAGEEKYHRASSSTAWATTRRATKRSSAPAGTSRIGPASRCRPTAVGWLVQVDAGVVEERGLPAGHARSRRRRRRNHGRRRGRRQLRRRRVARRPVLCPHATRTRRAAVCLRPEVRHPQRAHWKEIVPQQQRRDPGGRRRVARADRGALPQGRDRRACACSTSDGKPQRELALPGLGSVASLGNERQRRRAVPVVHVVPDAHDDLARAVDRATAGAARRRPASGSSRRADRPERVRGRAGPLHLARRHAVSVVPGAQARRPRSRRQPPDAALRLRRFQRQHPAALGAAGGAVPGARRRLRGRDPARRRRVRRIVAPGRHARAQAERLRRFHRGGGMADRREDHLARAPGDLGAVERRPAHRRDDDPAARAVSRGDLRRSAAGHGSLSPLPDRAAVDSRVRFVRRSRAVQMAVRLLALPSRQGRRRLSGGADSHRGVGHARRSDARAQDDGAAAGGVERRRRCCCVSRARRATALASRSER